MADKESGLTLNKSKIQDINRAYIRGFDKFNRMYSNVASHLNEVKNGVIFMSVIYASDNISRARDRAQNTDRTRGIARSWITTQRNKILRKAEKVVVREYHSKISPGAVYVDGSSSSVNKSESNKSESKESSEGKKLIGEKTFTVNELLQEYREMNEDTNSE